MPKAAVLGLKPDVNWEAMLGLTKEVVDPGSRLMLASWARVGVDEDEAARIADAKRDVEAVADELRKEGYDTSVHTGIVAVSPGAELLRLAEEESADLIVIGLRKRSRVGKALLGSAAQRVLLGAPCPVLSSRVE